MLLIFWFIFVYASNCSGILWNPANIPQGHVPKLLHCRWSVTGSQLQKGRWQAQGDKASLSRIFFKEDFRRPWRTFALSYCPHWSPRAFQPKDVVIVFELKALYTFCSPSSNTPSRGTSPTLPSYQFRVQCCPVWKRVFHPVEWELWAPGPYSLRASGSTWAEGRDAATFSCKLPSML